MSLKIEAKVYESANVFAKFNVKYIWPQFFAEVANRIAAIGEVGQKVYMPEWARPMWGIRKTFEVIQIYMPKPIFVNAEVTLRECLWQHFPRALLSPAILPTLVARNKHPYFFGTSKFYFNRKEFDAQKDTHDESLRVWIVLWDYLRTPQLRDVFDLAVAQVQECWIKSFLSNEKLLSRTDGTALRNAVLARTAVPQYYEYSYKKYIQEKKEDEAKVKALLIANASAAAPIVSKPFPKFDKPVVPLVAGKNAGATRSAGRSRSLKQRIHHINIHKQFKIGTIDGFRTIKHWLALKRAWTAYHKLPKKNPISIKLKKYLRQIELIMRRARDTLKSRKRLLYYVIRAEDCLKEAKTGLSVSYF